MILWFSESEAVVEVKDRVNTQNKTQEFCELLKQ